MKTYIPKEADIEREWVIIDATDKVLGKLAVEIANHLRGRHKPTYTPHLDTGDFVVIINAEKVRVTGNKAIQKTYQSYSGFMGGQKITTYADMMARKPEAIIEHAVWGMVPHNRLGRKLIGKLKVYAGAEHPHTAQQPTPIEL
ncbi:MAG TPA: 50S ribosomal protein L13 [Lentisphaeria bacterium]|jgi:large subunit ribosomal protein L13|nr:50S ribosomal protein L13 [Lentisphaeria bacterium]